MLIGLLVQFILNKISAKIGNPYDKKYEIIAMISNALLWGFYFNKYGLDLNVVIIAIISSVLISIIFIDFKYYVIPNEYNLFLFIIAVTYIALNHTHWKIFLFGGLATFVLFLLLLIASGGNLGGGDVKLAGNLGLIFGISKFSSFLTIAFLSGALISIFLLIFKIKKSTDKIAFGPYICIAFILIFTRILG